MVKRKGLTGLAGEIVAAGTGLEKTAVERGLDLFGSGLGFGGVGFPAQGARELGKEFHIEVIKRRAGERTRFRRQTFVVADAVVENALLCFRVQQFDPALRKFVLLLKKHCFAVILAELHE